MLIKDFLSIVLCKKQISLARIFTAEDGSIFILDYYIPLYYILENLDVKQVRMSLGSGSQITSPFEKFRMKLCSTYSTLEKHPNTRSEDQQLYSLFFALFVGLDYYRTMQIQKYYQY